MGKQINYWMGYEDFLIIAQAALDYGCIIIKFVASKPVYGQNLDIVTEDEHYYYFYVLKEGESFERSFSFEEKDVRGYTAAGNMVVQAGFSFKNDESKEITRSRLFVISGYYNDKGEYVARPEHVTKIYNKLVRVVKKIAPYTELTDTYINGKDEDYLQEKEWKHKEYISPRFLQLKLLLNYKLRQ